MRRMFTVLAALAIDATPLRAEITSSVSPEEVPERKQTDLGLYVTASEAAAALSEDPSILFIDVRDPAEAMFVGLAEPIDAIAPVRLLTRESDADRGRYRLVPNPDFVATVSSLAQEAGTNKTDPIIVICQAGRRAAQAANALGQAGFTSVWAVIDGFEGDLNAETGRHDQNGWKNAGLPWSYSIAPEQAWSPEG